MHIDLKLVFNIEVSFDLKNENFKQQFKMI